MAFEAITLLLAYKVIPMPTRPVRLSEHNSYDDRVGHDVLYLTNRGSLPIQVKSIHIARVKFLKIHPSVICVVVLPNVAVEMLATYLHDAIWRRYKKLA